jgi:hypothetical protein
LTLLSLFSLNVLKDAVSALWYAVLAAFSWQQYPQQIEIASFTA